MDYQTKKAQDLNTVRGKVRLILEEKPETRGNDTLLIVHFMEREGINGWGKLMDAAAKQSISFETIRRARQYIQAGGDYLPEDPVIIKRRKLQRAYEEIMRRDQCDTISR